MYSKHDAHVHSSTKVPLLHRSIPLCVCVTPVALTHVRWRFFLRSQSTGWLGMDFSASLPSFFSSELLPSYHIRFFSGKSPPSPALCLRARVCVFQWTISRGVGEHGAVFFNTRRWLSSCHVTPHPGIRVVIVFLFTQRNIEKGGAWCGCVQGAEPTGKHIPAIVVVFLFPAAKKVFLPSRGHGEAKDRNLNQTEPRTWWEDAAYSNLSSAARSGWWCGEFPVVPFSLGGDFSLSFAQRDTHRGIRCVGREFWQKEDFTVTSLLRRYRPSSDCRSFSARQRKQTPTHTHFQRVKLSTE